MVICLEQGADLHMAQRISLPLTVSCFSKIQIGFTFLVPAHPGSPGQRAVKRVCVSPYVYYMYCPVDEQQAAAAAVRGDIGTDPRRWIGADPSAWIGADPRS